MTSSPDSTALSQQPAARWLPLALALLSVWALIEAVLVWDRAPAPPPPALPDRMQLHGRWLERRAPSFLLAPLPDGVLLQSGADYSSGAGQPRLKLRWLALASSGSTVSLDPQRLSLSVLGSAGKGVCRMYDSRRGGLLGVAATDGEALALLRRNDPSGIERLQWALGLRPWRINRCLFVGVLPR